MTEQSSGSDPAPLLVVEPLRPGLWRWLAPHPDWTPQDAGPGGWEQLVGCIYLETPSAIVLIDPLAPPSGTPAHQRFWDALDRDVARLAHPVAVLLTAGWHDRSAQAVYDRYHHQPGAGIWAHEDSRWEVDCAVTDTFRGGSPLPGGVQAYEASDAQPGEALLYLPSHQALVAGDVLVGLGAGELRIGWASDDVIPALRRLLSLPIDLVLPSHGQPVLAGGGRALAAALEAPRWGR
jgi:glyoxylase-like metal-dependent hydrolase (beta-lactamase superfamily II)